jgi:hypothetical protein
MQQTTCNRRHTACNRQPSSQHAPCSGQPSTHDAPCKGQHAAVNKRHAAPNVQHISTTWKRQQTPCNAQRTSCNRQRATCDRQHAAGSAQRQQTTGDAQHLTDNRQRATASGRHARGSMLRATHARCSRKHTAPPHSAFRVRRAAGSGQPAAWAKPCTRPPARNTAQTPHKTMQHAPYDPCRSTQRTNTQPTTRSGQWNALDETNAIRTLALLEAA